MVLNDAGELVPVIQGVNIVQSSPVAVVPALNSTPSAYPTYTPYPTFTFVPTITVVPPSWSQSTPTMTPNAFLPSSVNWVFSYYYPALVGEDYEKYSVNCHPDNLIYSEWDASKVIGCADITASGLPWSNYLYDESYDAKYRGGVAVPFHPDTCPEIDKGVLASSCVPIYPMLSVIRVTAPIVIAGDYLVVDICPACGAYVYSHQVLFLDFLSRGLPSSVNFWDPVEVVEVVYP